MHCSLPGSGFGYPTIPCSSKQHQLTEAAETSSIHIQITNMHCCTAYYRVNTRHKHTLVIFRAPPDAVSCQGQNRAPQGVIIYRFYIVFLARNARIHTTTSPLAALSATAKKTSRRGGEQPDWKGSPVHCRGVGTHEVHCGIRTYGRTSIALLRLGEQALHRGGDYAHVHAVGVGGER